MQVPIGESELILTDKGTIYHLDLAPEQMADTIITVGDPGRVASVSKYFDRIEHKASHREFITHTGYVGNKRISVVSTGIGPDNIDIVLNELDALANINFQSRLPKQQIKSLTVIRLGTSGSLQSDVPVDSLVASTYGIGLDNMLHYYQYENNAEELNLLSELEQQTTLKNPVIKPYIAKGSQFLCDHFTENFVQGITVTCPGFFGPQGRVLRAAIAFPGLIDSLTSFQSDANRITNFEMETSAIYGLGKILGHQCLSINTIIANRVQKTFSSHADVSIDKMIKTSLEIIEKIVS